MKTIRTFRVVLNVVVEGVDSDFDPNDDDLYDAMASGEVQGL